MLDLNDRTPRQGAHDPLDDRRYMVWVLTDGQRVTSRQCNWNDVPLAAVEEIELHLKQQVVALRRCDLPSHFQEFVCFRTGGVTVQVAKHPRDGMQTVHVPFDSWTVGWTDGATEYLDEFNIKTGQHVRRYTAPRDFTASPTHWHKDSQRIVIAGR